MSEYSGLFKNVMRVEVVEGKYFPSRFSEHMMDFYSRIDEGKKTRARCSSGIKMEFYTKSEVISFRYTIQSYARPIVSFDIYENDRWVKCVREADGTQEGEVFYRKQQEGKVKLSIYLPYCCEIYIESIDIPKYEEVADEGECLMCLGDSITQGMTASSPSQTYACLIARMNGYRLINQGVGGYIFDAKSLADVTSVKPEHILVAYGTNDYTSSAALEELAENIESYMAELAHLSTAKSVTVITPIWRADCMSKAQKERFTQISQCIASVATQYHFRVIDGLDLVAHLDEFYVDGLHPNDLGFNMFALNFERVSKRIGAIR